MTSLPPGLGFICTPAEYERSLRDGSFRCLTRGDSFGLLIVVEASLLSLLALLFVFARILRNVIWRAKNLRGKVQVFQQPIDLLMSSLFFADMIQAVGGIQNIRWIRDGKIMEGGYCSSQGIIKNIGEVGVALSTLTIAAYTVFGVFSRTKIPSIKITLVILLVIWAFIFTLVAVENGTNHDAHFQTPVPLWCWIGKKYLQWRIWGEYAWMWLALGFSFFTYIPFYLWMRGNLVVDENTWWKCSLRSAREVNPIIRNRRRRSLVMLAYPIVYCLIILPLTIVRWIGFRHELEFGTNPVPAEWNFVGLAFFGLSGFLNVLLLLTTRPRSGLFGTLMFASEASRTERSYVLEQNIRHDPEDSSVDDPQHGDWAKGGAVAN